MKMRDALELEKLRTMSKTEQLEQRAKAAVGELLARYLVVPQIFFAARWPSRSKRVDVLAIDRAGAGDVHVVEIKRGRVAAKSAIPHLLDIPGNYLWLAIIAEISERTYRISPEQLLRRNDMGKIGIIRVEHTPNDRLSATVAEPAERFSGSLYDRADKFRITYKPDIEFR